jgi:hypothetical protein
MSDVESKSTYALTIFIHEGRGFHDTNSSTQIIWLQAKLFNEQVRCLPISVMRWGKTKFLSEFSWRLPRRQIHCIKSQKLVLKMEVLEQLDEEDQQVSTIGYVLVPLHAVPILDRHLPNPNWYKIQNHREVMGELCLSCAFGEYDELKRHIHRLRAQHKDHRYYNMVFDVEYVNEDYYQIGEGTDVYGLRIFPGFAENLYSILKDTQEPVYLYYSLFGKDIITTKHYRADRIEFPSQANTKGFRLRTHLGTLRLFLEHISPISIYLCQGKQVLGVTEVFFKTCIDLLDRPTPDGQRHDMELKVAAHRLASNELRDPFTAKHHRESSPNGIFIQVEDIYPIHCANERISLTNHNVPWIGVHYILEHLPKKS